MKIAIMTQPLGHNYGGLLQAYALQTYLKSLSNTVVTVDRRLIQNSYMGAKDSAVNLAKRLLGRIKSLPSEEVKRYIFLHLTEFKARNLSISEPITTERQVRAYFRHHNFDAVIVGSDQVWRPKYSPHLEDYFLDFLDDIGSTAKRLSYAASFGVSEWEFSEEQTHICKALIHKFDAVSVREQSAVSLCKDHFGMDAKLVIDPTLLLETADFEKLLNDIPSFNKGDIFTYVLDPGTEKQEIAKTVARTLNRSTFSVKPEMAPTQVYSNELYRCQYPKVESWLKGLKDSSYVVTDSFHGCVFAILFNKPFIAIGNRSRGQTRFDSLLSTFGLQDRLVSGVAELNEEMIMSSIDWVRVNLIKLSQAELSRTFLKNHIFNENRL